MRRGGFFLLIVLLLSLEPAIGGVLYIDAGHGGPTASQTDNGDGAGAVGPAGTAEQWVNLQVALSIKEILEQHGYVDSLHFWLFRTTDTTSRTLYERINQANQLADEFISIHHNGLPEGLDQQTEVRWCDNMADPNNPGADSPFEAYQDSLGRKLRYKLLDTLNAAAGDPYAYKDRCWIMDNPRPECGCVVCTLLVLRSARIANALTEASDISHHADEEQLFLDPFSGHTEDEAVAFYSGWHSYVTGQGFAVINYNFIPPLGLPPHVRSRSTIFSVQFLTNDAGN